jgi:hypothetical protein
MQASAMGAVSALRETSVVFAALLGAVFLNARLTGLRIAACWSSPPAPPASAGDPDPGASNENAPVRAGAF